MFYHLKMSRITSVFILFFTLVSFSSSAQDTAIKIVSELKNQDIDSEETFTVTEIIGKDIYHITEDLSSTTTFTLINFRDDKMEYYMSDELQLSSGLDDWRFFQEEGELPYVVLNEYPDKTKSIKGREAMLIELQMNDGITKGEAWVDKKLFNRYKERYGLELTEGILEFSFTDDDFKIAYNTLSVEEVEVTEDFYSQLSHTAKENEGRGKALQKSLDSLITSLQEKEKQYGVESISSFQEGIARIQTSDKSFYINNQGEKIFDEIVENFHPYLFEDENNEDFRYLEYERDRERYHFIVQDNGRYRLVKKGGEPLHSGDFDKIETRTLEYFFNVYNAERMGIMDSWGKLIVPVKYQEIIPLTPRYFLVKRKSKYGVYDAERQKLSIKTKYEDVDYCGGCSVSSLLLKRKGKWGVVNLDGNKLLAFDYEHEPGTQRRADNWVSSLTKNGKKLLINLDSGKTINTDHYDNIFVLSKDLILYKKEEQFGLLQASGKPLIDEHFDFIMDQYLEDEKDYIKVFQREEGKLKVGLIDQQGQWILPIGKYDAANRYRNGFFSVKFEGKTGLLDQDQNQLLDLEYEFISAEILNHSSSKHQLGNVFSFSDFKKTGLYFADSNQLIEAKYEAVDRVFNKDSTQVYFLTEMNNSQNDKDYELFSAEGEQLLSQKYDRITHLTDDLFEVTKDHKNGIYDVGQQKIIVKPEYDFISEFDESHLLIRRNREQQLLHISDRKFVLKKYSYFAKTNEENLWVIGDDKKGKLYNTSTKKIISDSFNHGTRDEWEFKQGLMAVNTGYTTGVINTEGKIIIPFQYSQIEVLSNGYLRMVEEISESKNKIYFADNDGKIIHDEAFTEHPYYGEYEGEALAGNLLVTSNIDSDGETVYGLMDLSGKERVKPQYTNLQARGDKGFITQVKNTLNDPYNFTMGLLDNEGKEIIAPVLETVLYDVYHPVPDNNNTVPVKVDQYYFYLDETGKVLPFISQKWEDRFME